MLIAQLHSITEQTSTLKFYKFENEVGIDERRTGSITAWLSKKITTLACFLFE